MMKKRENYSVQGSKSRTILFTGTMLDINYIARTSTAGKELNLVSRYVDLMVEKYEKLKRKRAAIFIEPQLDSGYPDIVIAEFSSMPEHEWHELRKGLSVIDLKLLFYIQTHGKCQIRDLQKTLGFPIEIIQKAVLKLAKCSLVHVSSNNSGVRPVSLKSYCRINKIISIEAKIDKWNEAIRQAGNNVWFSTESYILMNKDSCSDSIQATCRELGIGIILLNGTARTVLPSHQRKFPVSHASLQFNEWILRYINMRGEKHDGF